MALTFSELEAITLDYFKADNKRAIDVYFNTSFLLKYLMDQKKGLWERPDGGARVRVPLEYDGQEGGFYNRAGSLSSDDKTSLNSAYYYLKHAYGNATVYRTDELSCTGPYEEVQLAVSKLDGAQKTATRFIAQNIYSTAADTADELTGIGAMTQAAVTIAYGGIIPNDLVSSDGSRPWDAQVTTTTEGISLAVIRTLASLAKVTDGAEGKPNVGVCPETLFNIIAGILQVQQRFQQQNESVDAGFTNLVFENKVIAADDFCQSGTLYLLNTKYVGFAIHKQGFFARTPWADLLVAGLAAKSMKIFWDGNLICSRRRAHAAHTNLS